MFSYRLPDGYPNIKVTYNAAGNVVFSSPLHKQAYEIVISILEDQRWNFHFKKIVDIGCGEMRLFKLLRRLEYVESILNVDIDETCLQFNKSRVKPLVSDHLRDRPYPLRADIYKGSICTADENLLNADAVIALDVIQELTTAEIKKMHENLFDFIQAKLILISTPNRDFNELLNGGGGGGADGQQDNNGGNNLRSPLNKFEWSRKEFKNWAKGICAKYPNYSYALLGIGPAPPDCRLQCGCATQLAIFARNDIIERDLVQPLKTASENSTTSLPPQSQASQAVGEQFKLIEAIEFPFHIDKSTKEEKIEAEIANYLQNAHKNEQRYYNRELCVFQFPIAPLLEYAQTIAASGEDVLNVIKSKNYRVENDFIVMTQDQIDAEYNCVYYDDVYEKLDEDDDYMNFEEFQHRFYADDDDGGGGALDGDFQFNGDEDDICKDLNDACRVTDEKKIIHDNDEENWD